VSACLVFKLINLIYDYLQSCFSSLQYEHFKPFVFFPQVLQFIENPSVSYLDVFEYLYTKIIAAKIPTAAKTIHNNILLFRYTKIKSSVEKILGLSVLKNKNSLRKNIDFDKWYNENFSDKKYELITC